MESTSNNFVFLKIPCIMNNEPSVQNRGLQAKPILQKIISNKQSIPLIRKNNHSLTLSPISSKHNSARKSSMQSNESMDDYSERLDPFNSTKSNILNRSEQPIKYQGYLKLQNMSEKFKQKARNTASFRDKLLQMEQVNVERFGGSQQGKEQFMRTVRQQLNKIESNFGQITPEIIQEYSDDFQLLQNIMAHKNKQII